MSMVHDVVAQHAINKQKHIDGLKNVAPIFTLWKKSTRLPALSPVSAAQQVEEHAFLLSTLMEISSIAKAVVPNNAWKTSPFETLRLDFSNAQNVTCQWLVPGAPSPGIEDLSELIESVAFSKSDANVIAGATIACLRDGRSTLIGFVADAPDSVNATRDFKWYMRDNDIPSSQPS